MGNLSTVPAAALGGHVTSILVQQAVRRKNMRALTSVQGGYAMPTAWVGAIPVSVRSQETFQLDAEVTQHAIESGAFVHDHIILHPIKMNLVFEVTNWDKEHPGYVLDLFEALWRSRTPLQLLTQIKLLDNMMLTSFSADNSVPVWGAITCRASFQQITLVTPDKVLFPTKVRPTSNTGGPPKAKAAEAAQPNVSIAKTGLAASANLLKSMLGGG